LPQAQRTLISPADMSAVSILLSRNATQFVRFAEECRTLIINESAHSNFILGNGAAQVKQMQGTDDSEVLMFNIANTLKQKFKTVTVAHDLPEALIQRKDGGTLALYDVSAVNASCMDNGPPPPILIWLYYGDITQRLTFLTPSMERICSGELGSTQDGAQKAGVYSNWSFDDIATKESAFVNWAATEFGKKMTACYQ